ncbi:MAG: glycosyltransferase [Candidatus Electrothrix sp. AW2]|nr:glycosyltransferase [Candidatus Electrothrix gigas]
MIKISVITVVFNGEKHLEEAIKSVLAQNYPLLEYIIIDGGSTDGTLEIIENYQNLFASIIVISEKDQGIYDAMNKGLVRATGDIIGILNSDDYYFDNSLEKVEKFFIDRNCDFVYGSIKKITSDGEISGITHPVKDIYNKYNMIYDIPFPHPALFVRKSVYDKVGLFDTSLKISADRDFIIRMIRSGVSGVNAEDCLVAFRDSGISSGIFVSYKEYSYIARKYGERFLSIFWNYLKTTTKRIARRILPKMITKKILKMKGSRYS